mmetsp:Transcript_12128/g.20713  ORF Transcript_12128/g.20713 Transcript_12128/m.20713 type:complete len:126 (-) Transcript_12128:811-1188(-)
MATALDDVEQAMSDIKKQLAQQEKTFEQLEKQALDTTTNSNDGNHDALLRECKLCCESITQLMIKLDKVQLSRDGAADALKQGDRATATRMSVMLARRKVLTQKLAQAGKNADALLHQLEDRTAD